VRVAPAGGARRLLSGSAVELEIESVVEDGQLVAAPTLTEDFLSDALGVEVNIYKE